MRALLYIIIVFIASGCAFTSQRSGDLDEARRLLASNPAEALSKLNGMDVSEFKDSATVARWALLYSEAMVENRLTAPTDTIINIAIDYYGRRNQATEFQKALQLKTLIHSTPGSDALATARYLQKEKEFLLYKERSMRNLYISAAIIMLLIAVGTIVWMRQRLKIETARNDALMAEASGLKCRIDESHGDVARLESKLQGSLSNRFALIDSLCQTYYESQGTKAERKAIVDKVKCEIESVRSDAFPKMEQAVNDCRDNLLAKVRDTYPAIKSDDYQLLVYISAGLSTRTISLLIGESVDVIYKRKSRLKSRMKESVAPSCPGIMEVF